MDLWIYESMDLWMLFVCSFVCLFVRCDYNDDPMIMENQNLKFEYQHIIYPHTTNIVPGGKNYSIFIM